MDLSQFLDSCLLHPEIMKLSKRVLNSDKVLDIVNFTDEQKRDALRAEIPLVLSKLGSAYPFPWLIKTTTFSGGTTSGTADYKIQGENQDCAQVLTVMYGSDEVFLEFYEQADIDRLASQVGITTEVVAWTVKGEQDGFPLITIIGTPSETGAQIKYRYWVDGDKLPFEKWPDKWLFVVKSELISRFVPQLTQIARDDFAGMLNAHNKGGSKVRRIIQDSTVIANNLRRNTKFGWGGGVTR